MPPGEGAAEGRRRVLRALDDFVHEKITVATRVLAEEAARAVAPGDVLLTYGMSGTVAAALELAHAVRGTVDSVWACQAFPQLSVHQNLYRPGSQYCPVLSHTMLHSHRMAATDAADALVREAACVLGGACGARQRPEPPALPAAQSQQRDNHPMCRGARPLR